MNIFFKTNPDEIDENNLLLYLGIVEERTNDLITLYQDVYSQEEKSGRQDTKASNKKTEEL